MPSPAPQLGAPVTAAGQAAVRIGSELLSCFEGRFSCPTLPPPAAALVSGTFSVVSSLHASLGPCWGVTLGPVACVCDLLVYLPLEVSRPRTIACAGYGPCVPPRRTSLLGAAWSLQCTSMSLLRSKFLGSKY